MSQEIVYTSAPRGLKPGSRGFCTVASTAGMARNLAERLESLSGYRHVYLPHEDKAQLNPVNFSHLSLRLGGSTHHILSRVSDAGLDYSQRSNKIAHHVVLDANELVVSGPAWVLMDPDFSVSQWDGEPKLLRNGRDPRNDACPAMVCRLWHEVTGDAGWAAVLAANAMASTPTPITIIYPVRTNVLQLVVEAMSLLPVARRWNVTFSTYFTSLPVGFECQWRFVLEGTPEADRVRHSHHVTKIDLLSKLGAAPANELTSSARTGVPSIAEASAASEMPLYNRASAPLKSPLSAPCDAPKVDAERTRQVDAYNLARPSLRPRLAANERDFDLDRDEHRTVRVLQHKRSRWMKYAAILAVAITILGGIAALLYQNATDTTVKASVESAAVDDKARGATKPQTPPAVKSNAEVLPQEPASKELASDKTDAEPNPSQEHPAQQVITDESEKLNSGDKPSDDQEPATHYLEALRDVLFIPEFKDVNVTGEDQSHVLGPFNAPVAATSFQFVPTSLIPDDIANSLAVTGIENKPEWHILRRKDNSKQDEIATLMQMDGNLVFAWKNKLSSNNDICRMMQYFQLGIVVGRESKTYYLSSPPKMLSLDEVIVFSKPTIINGKSVQRVDSDLLHGLRLAVQVYNNDDELGSTEIDCSQDAKNVVLLKVSDIDCTLDMQLHTKYERESRQLDLYITSEVTNKNEIPNWLKVQPAGQNSSNKELTHLDRIKRTEQKFTKALEELETKYLPIAPSGEVYHEFTMRVSECINRCNNRKKQIAESIGANAPMRAPYNQRNDELKEIADDIQRLDTLQDVFQNLQRQKEFLINLDKNGRIECRLFVVADTGHQWTLAQTAGFK